MLTWFNISIISAACLGPLGYYLYLVRRNLSSKEDGVFTVNFGVILFFNLLCWGVLFAVSLFINPVNMIALGVLGALSLVIPFLERRFPKFSFFYYLAAVAFFTFFFFDFSWWQIGLAAVLWTMFIFMWDSFNLNYDSQARAGLGTILACLIFISLLNPWMEKDVQLLFGATTAILWFFLYLIRYPLLAHSNIPSIHGLALLVGYMLVYAVSRGNYIYAVLVPMYYFSEVLFSAAILIINKAFKKKYDSSFYYQKALFRGGNPSQVGKVILYMVFFLSCLAGISTPEFERLMVVLGFLIVCRVFYNFSHWGRKNPTFRELIRQSKQDLKDAYDHNRTLMDIVLKKKDKGDK